MNFLLGLWTGLPPWAQKIAEYTGLLLLAFWLFKVFWLNPHDNKIAYEAKTQATEQIRKEEEAKWKAVEEKLKADNADLAKQASSARAALIEGEKSRTAIISALNTSITQSRTIQETRHAQVDSLPASELVGAIRALSNELAKSAVH